MGNIKRDLRYLMMPDYGALYPILTNAKSEVIEARECGLIGATIRVKGELIMLDNMFLPGTRRPLWREGAPHEMAPWSDFVLKFDEITVEKPQK